MEHHWRALTPFWFSMEHHWRALTPFWFSMEHHWRALTPFWFSMEHRWRALTPFWFSMEHHWRALTPFWFSMEHHWRALTPFWFSADNTYTVDGAWMKIILSRKDSRVHYTDGDFWRREHHGMFLSRGLKWYWGKIISPRDEVERLIIFPKISFQNPKILGTFGDVPDNKVTICYIIWLPIDLPGFWISCTNFLQYFSPVGISLSCAQCNAYLLYCARNKQSSRGQGRSTYMFEAIVSQAEFAICLREKMCGIDQCSSSAALGRATYWNVCRSRDCV